jgi:hypothetical protein
LFEWLAGRDAYLFAPLRSRRLILQKVTHTPLTHYYSVTTTKLLCPQRVSHSFASSSHALHSVLIHHLLTSAAKSPKKSGEKKEKRPPSAYNAFMKTELAKVKKEHPGLDHKAAFTKAAGNWKNSPQNPKNKK